MSHHKAIAVILFMIFFMTNCAYNYLRVDLTVNTNLSKGKPEITESKSYQSLRGTIKRVVISLPLDYYEIISASDSLGISKTQAVIKEDYAIGITEIEKLLTERGVIVLSHLKFKEISREKETENEAAIASLLGADAVIQVNHIDYNTQVPIQQITTINMKFYNADAKGSIKGKASLDEDSKNQILNKLKVYQNSSTQLTAYIGNLDCKVVYAKTGEIIWFYSHRRYLSSFTEQPKHQEVFLFEMVGSPRIPKWELVNPEIDSYSKSDVKNQKYSEITIQESSFGKSEFERKIKDQVVKLICEEFVNNFLGR